MARGCVALYLAAITKHASRERTRRGRLYEIGKKETMAVAESVGKLNKRPAKKTEPLPFSVSMSAKFVRSQLVKSFRFGDCG